MIFFQQIISSNKKIDFCAKKILLFCGNNKESRSDHGKNDLTGGGDCYIKNNKVFFLILKNFYIIFTQS